MSPQFPPKGRRRLSLFFPPGTEWEQLVPADLAADIRSYQDRWNPTGTWTEDALADEMRQAAADALEARILAVPAVAAVDDVCRTRQRAWLQWQGRRLSIGRAGGCDLLE